jgi:hypothetical protein
MLDEVDHELGEEMVVVHELGRHVLGWWELEDFFGADRHALSAPLRDGGLRAASWTCSSSLDATADSQARTVVHWS